MLVCADRSFYVGSTSHGDVHVRVDEHNSGKFNGYTASRRPVSLVWAKHFDDLREAQQTERRLKGWSRAKKTALLADDEAALFSLSSRRGGKTQKSEIANLTKRELVALAHSTGAKMGSSWVKSRKTSVAPRTDRSDVPTLKLVTSRHPEVRAKRAPKDV